MKSKAYNKSYYETQAEGSLQSAMEVIPVILQYIIPQSVVDVGCGIGTWLSIWKKNGVTDILGIDGDYINSEQLLINKKKFLSADLEKEIQHPRQYDLVMSLEVAEHLQPASAAVFIHSLCQLGDVVVFSAAIPYQGGVLHYNEQYPDYWIKHFAEAGFSPYDVLREKIWHNKKIDASYRQNILLFVRNKVKEKFPLITKESKAVLPLVHPDFFEYWMRQLGSYKHSLKTPFHAGWFFIKKYFKFFRLKLGYGRKI